MGNGVSVNWKNQGNGAFGSGSYGEAVKCYTKAMEASPMDAKLFSNRAASYLKLRKFALALQDAQVAVSLAPDWPKGYYRAGLAMEGLNMPHAALDNLGRALALEPGNAAIAEKIEQIKALSAAKRPAMRGHGSLFTWGIGQSGVLGLGDTKDKFTAKAVDVFRDKQVIDVSCGMLHAVAVTVTGETWAWGANKQWQCGLGHDRDMLTPHVIPGLLGKSVTAVACGGGHTVVLTADGAAYSWGTGGKGQLGHGDSETRFVPTLVDYFQENDVQAAAVTCGMGHTFVLDHSSACYAFGWNDTGQLGLGHTDGVLTPTLVEGVADIQHVASGAGHSVIVTATGKLYSTGSGSCGQLGHGDKNDTDTFTQVQALSDSVIALAACGEEFTVALTRQRQVFSFGLGNVGQLGIGRLGDSATPVLVEAVSDKQVELLGCTQGQVVAITRTGQVYSWGMPGDQLSTPSDEMATPKRLEMLKRQRVMRLECGRRFYCAVVSGTAATNCVLTGIPSECMAGTRAKGKLQAVDMFDEPVTRGGDSFSASLVHQWNDDVTTDVELFDNFDGTYDVTIKLTMFGSYTLYLTLGGHHVKGSPFHIDVTCGDIDVAQCLVHMGPHASEGATGDAGATEVTVMAGEELTLDVELRDRWGNLCHSAEALARLAGTTSGASAPDVHITVHDDSVVGGDPSGRGAGAGAGAGSGAGSGTEAGSGAGSGSGEAESGGLMWRAGRLLARRITAAASFSACGDHSMSVALRDVGDASEYGGAPLPPGPFTVHVVPAPAVPGFCLAEYLHSGETASAARSGVDVPAGTAVHFGVSCFDKHGNHTPLGADVTARMEGPDAVSCLIFRRDAPEARDLPVSDAVRPYIASGSEWVVAACPVQAGTYELHIGCGPEGDAISGSPFTIRVCPGDTDALFSSVSDTSNEVDAALPPPTPDQLESAGASPGDAGAAAEWVVWQREAVARRTLTVDARDVWGNHQVKGGDAVQVKLQRARGGIITAAPGIVEVEDQGNGSYSVSYELDAPGRYFLEVNINGTPLAGSPFAFAALVHPDELARREAADEERRRASAAEAARVEAERRRAAEAEQKRQADEAAAAAAAAAEAEALRKQEEQRRRLEEIRLRQEEERRLAKEKAEAEAKARAEAREKRKQAKLQAKKEREAKRKAEEEARKRREVMAKLRQEEMTRRRAAEALARAQRERAAEAERVRRLKNVKRTGGGFVVKFDGSDEKK